jgi:hypothetical protein
VSSGGFGVVGPGCVFVVGGVGFEAAVQDAGDSRTQAGDVIPAAVSPPHDQRAHGLPQDLKGQSGKC